MSFQSGLFCWVFQMLQKVLSKLLTCIISAVKAGHQSYSDSSYSRGSVNQTWVLNTSKDLLEYIQSRFLSSCNSIKAFDFSTLYTTIPYPKQKENLKELVQLCFSKTNGQRIYKYLVLGRNRSYFVTTITVILPKRSLKLISSTSSSFFIDNIFVIFSGRFFQQTYDIPMGTNCVPLLADLFFYSYEANFIQGFHEQSEKKLARSFNFMFRYIDDVLSLNNHVVSGVLIVRVVSAFVIVRIVSGLVIVQS